jgi:hypothetical protein
LSKAKNVKNEITVIAVLAGAVSAFSQGTVSMYDYGPTFSIQLFSLYDPAGGGTFVVVNYGGYTAGEEMGNTANPNEIPAGHITYDGVALGAGYDVQLLAAPGLNDQLNTLLPSSAPITTWYSGSASTGLGGFWDSTELGTVNGSTTTATVALAAWYNDGATLTTLPAAQAAGVSWGISATGNITALGGVHNPPPTLPDSIETFTVGTASPSPEPGTLALMLTAGLAFGARRRFVRHFKRVN